MLFKDKEIAKKILESQEPREQKALGRRVSNFDEEVWKQKCKEIVKRGNEAKVSLIPITLSMPSIVHHPTEHAQ